MSYTYYELNPWKRQKKSTPYGVLYILKHINLNDSISLRQILNPY